MVAREVGIEVRRRAYGSFAVGGRTQTTGRLVEAPGGRCGEVGYSVASLRAMRDFLFAALFEWITPLVAALSSSRAACW